MGARFTDIRLKKKRGVTILFVFLFVTSFVLINYYVDMGENMMIYFGLNFLGAFLSWLFGTGNPLESGRKLRFRFFRNTHLTSFGKDVKMNSLDLDRLKSLNGIIVKEQEDGKDR